MGSDEWWLREDLRVRDAVDGGGDTGLIGEHLFYLEEKVLQPVVDMWKSVVRVSRLQEKLEIPSCMDFFHTLGFK